MPWGAGGPTRSSGEAPVMGWSEGVGSFVTGLLDQPGYAWEELRGRVESTGQAI